MGCLLIWQHLVLFRAGLKDPVIYLWEAAVINNSASLVPPAGLSHTPRSDKSEVFFNMRESETYLPYVKALRDFMKQYDDSIQSNNMLFEDCGGRLPFILWKDVWETGRKTKQLLCPTVLFHWPFQNNLQITSIEVTWRVTWVALRLAGSPGLCWVLAPALKTMILVSRMASHAWLWSSTGSSTFVPGYFCSYYYSLLLCLMSYIHISFWVLYIFLSHLLPTLSLLPFSFYILLFSFHPSFLSLSFLLKLFKFFLDCNFFPHVCPLHLLSCCLCFFHFKTSMIYLL